MRRPPTRNFLVSPRDDERFTSCPKIGTYSYTDDGNISSKFDVCSELMGQNGVDRRADRQQDSVMWSPYI